MSEEKIAFDRDSAMRFETGRVFVAGVMGAAFAASLTIAGSAIEGELAHKALLALVSSLPLLGVHFVVTAPGHEKRYSVSKLMRLMPVLGVMSSVTGLALLFENSVRGAGLVFGAFSTLCTFVCSTAGERKERLGRMIRHQERACN